MLFLVRGVLVAALLIGLAPGLAQAKERGVSSSVLIKATPAIVWEAVSEQRKLDPDLAYSKVISRGTNEYIIEQKFTALPFLGEAVALLHETEDRHKVIKYRLLKSDKFRALEGSWVLTSVDGGKSTRLELNSYVDIGIPFSGPFVREVTARRVKRRLANVKMLAEINQQKIVNGIEQRLN